MLLDIEQSRPPVADLYRLITSCVVPRPIALVSTVSPDGRRNLAPFSYFNFVSTAPLLLMFAPILNSKGEEKDTLRNIAATKEFVVSMVTQSMAAAANQTAADYPSEVDEFAETGLTPAPATHLPAALVKESPINFECRLHDILRFSEGPHGGRMVLGEVIAIHIDDAVLGAGGRVDPDKLQAIGRMGGSAYCNTTDWFEMERPSSSRGATLANASDVSTGSRAAGDPALSLRASQDDNS